MLEITKTFGFEAAHFQPAAPEGHPNRRVHGHSFVADVTLAGEASPQKGMIRDFEDVDRALARVRDLLDHQLLNDIAGLGVPTLEHLARFIFDQVKGDLPEIVRVAVRRPALGQTCCYAPAVKGHS